MRYLYLHGLGSSPNSAKAKYLAGRFRSRGLELELRDFNLDSAGAFNFAGLTLTRKIAQTQAWIQQASDPVTLIGSSLGGLTAAWVAQGCPQVERLVLLAPAFKFLTDCLLVVDEGLLQQWKQAGEIEFFHHGQGQPEMLGYRFMTELETYDEERLTRSLPTLILHGTHDETVPFSASQQYAEPRDWVQLIELDSDHSLGNSVSRIWREIQTFCDLP